MASEENLKGQYKTAKTLLDKTKEIMNLQYEDIVVLTTRATYLESLRELKNLKPNQETIQSKIQNDHF